MIVVYNYREFEDVGEQIPYAEHDTIFLKGSVIYRHFFMTFNLTLMNKGKKASLKTLFDREKVRNGPE